MPIPVSFASWTYNDNTRKSNGEPESSSFRLPIITLTPANVAANETLVDNLTAAIDAVVIGVLARESLIFDETFLSDLPAPSQLAQRENKLLLRYHATSSGKKYRVSIPTFDLTTLPNNSEFLNLAAGVGAALKTAFEAIVRSPDDDGDVVVLDTAQFVGRNT